MSLRPDLARRFHDLIVGAFTREELEQLMRFALDEKVDAVVSHGANLSSAVFEIVEWAAAAGDRRLTQLVAAVRAARPDRTDIVQICDEIDRSVAESRDRSAPAEDSIDDVPRAGNAAGDRSGLDKVQILKSAAQVVTFLLAAFGGFLRGIAPPEETGITLVLGFASFLCLIVFLLISSLARTVSRRTWLIVSGGAAVSFLVAGPTYQRALQDLTFVWTPGETYVTGNHNLMPKAQEVVRANPGVTAYDLVAGFGGIDKSRHIDKRSAVWPYEAILASSRKLTAVYIWVVLSAAIAVFCAIEGRYATPYDRRKTRSSLVIGS